MSEGRSTGPWILGALAAAAAIGVAVWRLDASAPLPSEPPTAVPTPEPAAQPPPAPESELPLEAAAESYRIAERGRIAISSKSFTPGVPVAFDLDLRDEARGSGERPVRIVAVDGRHLSTTASPRSEQPGSGMRLELDPEWLVPGRYLIEIKTAERTHFPMQRYVLEVR